MSRVKGGILHAKHRRNILKKTKGYRWGRKSKMKLAKVAVKKAGQYAWAGRRTKKRLNRNLWALKINASARELNTTYSQLLGKLKKAGVALDRKVLSQLAEKYPNIFKAIVSELK